MLVVPEDVRIADRLHLILSVRQSSLSQEFILERQDESLDNGDAAVLADGSESQLDYKTLCPAFEGIAPELLAVIADDVLGSLAAVLHGLAEELANIL